MKKLLYIMAFSALVLAQSQESLSERIKRVEEEAFQRKNIGRYELRTIKMPATYAIDDRLETGENKMVVIFDTSTGDLYELHFVVSSTDTLEWRQYRKLKIRWNETVRYRHIQELNLPPGYQVVPPKN